MEHLQTMKILIERATEYKIPLWIAFIDYRKAFDTVEIWAVTNALRNARIDSRYISIVEKIYQQATMQIQLHEKSERVKLKRGQTGRQSITQTVYTSFRGCTKKIEWNGRGINVADEYLHHLRFADDIAVFAKSREELTSLI